MAPATIEASQMSTSAWDMVTTRESDENSPRALPTCPPPPKTSSPLFTRSTLCSDQSTATRHLCVRQRTASDLHPTQYGASDHRIGCHYHVRGNSNSKPCR